VTGFATGFAIRVLAMAILIGAGLAGCATEQGSDVQAVEPVSGEGRLCSVCHASHYSLWSDGGHRQVSCTYCHGPAGDHVRADIDPRPEMQLRSRPDLCIQCHGRLKSFGGMAVPTVKDFEAHVNAVSEKHSVPIDIERTGGKCTFCHDPHSLE
jgi:hypothetical protein